MLHAFGFATSGDPTASLRELNRRQVVLRLDPIGDHARARFTVQARRDLRIIDAHLTGVSHASAREQHDEVLVGIVLAGTSEVRCGGEQLCVARGDAVLLRVSEGNFSIAHPQRVHFLGLRMPRGAVLGGPPLQHVRRGTPALDLLVGYTRDVLRTGALRIAGLADRATAHVHDLVAHCSGLDRDAAEPAIRAARLRAVLRDIDDHLTDPSLRATAVAERLRVSPRYVHRLLEERGQTFSEVVNERRLARAYAQLASSTQSISEIAFAVGFNDLSYFARLFRRRFGMTPREHRARRR